MKSLMFFHASWCGPCKKKEKDVIDPLVEKYGSDRIVKIDAWNNPVVAEKFGVGRLPALFFCNPEKHEYQRVDNKSLSELEVMLNDPH